MLAAGVLILTLCPAAGEAQATTKTGTNALVSLTSGIDNTADGGAALEYDTTGSSNTATGFNALNENVSGAFNTANGQGSLSSNRSGIANTGLGYQALHANTTGTANTANGYQALGGCTTDSQETATGYQALFHDSVVSAGLPNDNVADGFQALYSSTTGYENLGSGVQALFQDTAGSDNVAVGYEALSKNTVGSGNIAVGVNAGSNLTTGSANIDIGSPGVAGESGIVRIGDGSTQTDTYLTGIVHVSVLAVQGGADLAEPFRISKASQRAVEGDVVVIDDAHPGLLTLSDRPYDARVAGVVSGANGVHPGIRIEQLGLNDGGKNVALTGRVYVHADTENGPIKPGDLLTTSSMPGTAMKVTDRSRAQGAILGKAMTRLDEGQGMVLVLVTLQ
jgi:hypothetical protein